IDAVEAHGTGTTLGDPIEAQALIAAYGTSRTPDRPLWLGSVKSNIGHAQAAAGIAGIIKMILALRHATLPATLHIDAPTPHVAWPGTGTIRLLTAPVPWTGSSRPRRAAISAFGVSGTNAHIIIEEPPAPAPQDTSPAPDGTGPAPDTSPVLLPGGADTAWPVSARTGPALAAHAARLHRYLAARPALDPADIAWSLAAGRAGLEHRAVITAAARTGLLDGLAALAAGQPAAAVTAAAVPPAGPGKTVFVFPGQGGQWPGMGRDLAAASPVFAARLAECAAALAPFTDWSLIEVITGAPGAPALDRVDIVQPALWAVMVSLAAVWEAAGITPDAVAGHSQGEIAAAAVAGILTLPDAARIIALRSQALTALAGHGGMLSLAEPADRAAARITPWGQHLSLAAVNGPAATVISGDPAALDELAAACTADGIRTRPVPVDYASHSPQVTQLRTRILTDLAPITPAPARIPMISAMTGQWITGPELGPAYWYDSLRATVNFHHAIQALTAAGHTTYIETSPHPVLAPAIADQPGTPLTVTGTLRRDDGGPARLLASLAAAWTAGLPVTWPALLPGHRIDLPTYPFQHQRYWPAQMASASAGDAAAAGLVPAGHPLLTAAVRLADGAGLVLAGRITVTAAPWLADHVVAGTVLLPGTAFVDLAAHAARLCGAGQIEELVLETPLALPPHGAVALQVTTAGPGPDGRHAIQIHAPPPPPPP
ncbi:MAG TPA: type I polyketide synthase, partial [Actinomycetes bacterium]|nr:type I polyketide synthase [Actinomycetes bacterium]